MINIFLVICGIILQVISFVFAHQILKRFSNLSIRRGWLLLLILISGFITGYGLFLSHLLKDNTSLSVETLNLLVSLIFFFGAIFVIFVTRLSRFTLNNLQNEKTRTKQLEEEKMKYLESGNHELEQIVLQRTKQLEETKSLLESEVEKRTKDLKEKVTEMEKTNSLLVGRELRIQELKEQLQKSKS